MNKVRCPNCGSEATVERGNWPFEKETGLKGVVLPGVEIIRCPHCRTEMPILRGVNRIMRTVALALVNKPYRLNGAEVRFLRKHVGMTQEGFSQLIHVDKTTLSKWETGDDPVGIHSDLLTRLAVLALDKELCGKAAEIVQHFAQIQEKQRKVGIQVHPEEATYQYA
jgi:putative zinc finger/helix-turn-helix YgiT family protein